MEEENIRLRVLVKVFTIISLVLIYIVALCGCKGKSREDSTHPHTGMFEWNENRIYDTNQVKQLVDRLDVTEWYQEMQIPVRQREMEAFVTKMTQMNVNVYALVGETQWGYEADGSSLISYLEIIAKYNRKAGLAQKVKGVMADIEPYVLEEWDENPVSNMEIYVEGMIKAYRYAKKQGLDFIVCIPRHYDDQGLKEQLEELIAEGCDEVAVMNYECGNEVEKIKTEAELARKYGRVLHCILEFQDVGKHGLVEEKTYRNKGIEAAGHAWSEVSEAYQRVKLIRDYHWSEPILQIFEEQEVAKSE